MRIASTLVFGLIAGLAAQAQDGRGPGRGRFPAINVGFSTIDTNHDGTLDASEIDAAPTSLSQLDKNADGQITSDEIRASMPQGRGREGMGRGGPGRGREEEAPPQNIAEETVKTLMAFDANGDGKLSRAELPDRFQGIFNRGDENHDGFLTPDEIRKVAAAQAAPPETSGPGRRGGPEGGRGDGPRREINFIRIDPVLAAIDSDGDGMLSPDEIKHAAASIRKLDKDGDGSVSQQEASPAPGPGRQF